MKPAPFKYYAPTNVQRALELLSEHGWDAKVLAGGQSLIPLMNFRLAQPSVLIDLNKIPELSFIRSNENCGLRIGAMTRYSQVENSSLVTEKVPLLNETMPNIATKQIRNRGTIGGSISHADPAAELVSVSVALNGRFLLRSKNNERWVPANEFFIGLLTTSLLPEELLVEIELPSMPPRTGWALLEIARRPHDFALAGVVATVTLDNDGRCKSARLVYLSLGDGPMDARQAAKNLYGHFPSSEVFQDTAEIAANSEIDPSSDIHASREFRLHLAKVLTCRALETAFKRARRGS